MNFCYTDDNRYIPISSDKYTVIRCGQGIVLNIEQACLVPLEEYMQVWALLDRLVNGEEPELDGMLSMLRRYDRETQEDEL